MRAAAAYLMQSSASTAEDRRLAPESIEWLRARRDEPAAVNRERKGK